MIKQQGVKNSKVCMSSAKNNNLYRDLPSRIDTLLGEDKHLHQLKQLADARSAFVEEFRLNSKERIPTQKFGEWLLERWGLELVINGESGGLAGFNVIDEQKFLLFQLVFP